MIDLCYTKITSNRGYCKIQSETKVTCTLSVFKYDKLPNTVIDFI